MQLKHYAQVFLRSVWVILIGTALCAGSTYMISRVIKPVYQSSALIQVNTLSPLVNDSVYGNQALAINYALLITNDDVLRKAALKLPGMSTGDIASALSVAPEDTTAIIQVQAKANDSQMAADIANAVANAFIQVQEAKNTSRFQGMADHIAQELVTEKTNVTQAQATLTQLQATGAPASRIASQQSVLEGYQTDYNALLTSYQQVKVQQVQLDSSLVEIQAATPSGAPVSPKIVSNTLIAAALGFLLLLILVFVLDWLNTTIKTPEDVANLAGLTALGSVPETRNPLLYNAIQSVASEDAIEQASIIISTNVKVSGKTRIVLVTGTKAGVGTTTSAANLAVSLAQMGVRVMLVDANIARPALHTVFRSSDAGGWVYAFADPRAVSSNVTADMLLQPWRTEVPNLWFLPLGALPARYSVVRLASQLETVMKRLVGQNSTDGAAVAIDMVIIDAPALSDGANTVALASIAQSSILVVKAGEERSRMLSDAATKLKVLNAPLLGVIVNRQKGKHRPYFYVDNYRSNTVLAINAPETDKLEVPQGVSPSLPVANAGRTRNPNSLLSWPKPGMQHAAANEVGEGNPTMPVGPAVRPEQGPSWSGLPGGSRTMASGGETPPAGQQPWKNSFIINESSSNNRT